MENDEPINRHSFLKVLQITCVVVDSRSKRLCFCACAVQETFTVGVCVPFVRPNTMASRCHFCCSSGSRKPISCAEVEVLTSLTETLSSSCPCLPFLFSVDLHKKPGQWCVCVCVRVCGAVSHACTTALWLYTQLHFAVGHTYVCVCVCVCVHAYVRVCVCVWDSWTEHLFSNQAWPQSAGGPCMLFKGQWFVKEHADDAQPTSGATAWFAKATNDLSQPLPPLAGSSTSHSQPPCSITSAVKNNLFPQLWCATCAV